MKAGKCTEVGFFTPSHSQVDPDMWIAASELPATGRLDVQLNMHHIRRSRNNRLARQKRKNAAEYLRQKKKAAQALAQSQARTPWTHESPMHASETIALGSLNSAQAIGQMEVTPLAVSAPGGPWHNPTQTDQSRPPTTRWSTETHVQNSAVGFTSWNVAIAQRHIPMWPSYGAHADGHLLMQRNEQHVRGSLNTWHTGPRPHPLPTDTVAFGADAFSASHAFGEICICRPTY